MPKIPIDYSKTIIYKIVCNDLSVTDCYVGHTTNWIKRKTKHKHSCCNENSKGYNYKVYEFIRENGGWDNWIMVQIEEFCCNNKREAELRERYWYEELKGTLNARYPSRTQKQYRQTNREQLIEKQKEYREANKEQIKEQGIIYRESNKEKKRDYDKEYAKLNKERLKEYRKQYYQAKKLNPPADL